MKINNNNLLMMNIKSNRLLSNNINNGIKSNYSKINNFIHLNGIIMMNKIIIIIIMMNFNN